MSTQKYQPLVQSTNNTNDIDDTSLQPFANDSFSNSSDLSINNNTEYHSIQSYNKNKQNNNNPITPPVIPVTPKSFSYDRNSSPIPPLLRSASSLLRFATKLEAGSLRASTFTVITGMVGGGTFTFSYGIYMSGVIPSIIYLILIASLAGYSTHAIVTCAEMNNCPSFRTLAIKLYNKRFAQFIQICLLLLLWMACISYMTLTKNLLSTSVDRISIANNNNSWYNNKIILLLCASIIPTILALQKKVSALRYASLCGLICILFVMVLVIRIYFTWCNKQDNNPPGNTRECLFNNNNNNNIRLFNNNIIEHTYTISIFFGGFAAQFTILPIYFEMSRRSPSNMTKCITYGFIFTLLLYIFVGYFGYFTYPNLSESDKNLITLYKNDKLMLCAQILLALYVMAIIPLFAHAFRKSIGELIISYKNNNNNLSELRVDIVDDNAIISDAIENPHLAFVPISPKQKKLFQKITKKQKKNSINLTDELSLFWHTIITMTFLITAFGVSVKANNIGEVNSIIGSTTLPICCFIFPALCAYKTEHVSFRMKAITMTMAIFSIINAIFFFYDLFS